MYALAQGATFERALLSGMMSGVSGAAFSGIGSHLATHFGGGFAAGLSAGGFALKVALHGTVGGIAGALQGGRFGHGFAAAGLTALGSGFNNSRFVGGPGFSPARVAIAAAGGKFANGAVTGAFATIVGSASAAASDEVPVSAGKDVNHTDFSDKPAPQGNVLTTPEMDAAAADLASTMKVGWNEVALTVTSDGVIHRKKGSNSQSACLAGLGGYCLHTHPKERYTRTLTRRKGQDHRLGFGPKDWRIVQHGIPNYMLNFKRERYVLEYRTQVGYAPRLIGNVPLRE